MSVLRELRARFCWLIGHGRWTAWDEEADQPLVVICKFCLATLEEN